YKDFILRFEARAEKPDSDGIVYFREARLFISEGPAGGILMFQNKPVPESKGTSGLLKGTGQWNTWEITTIAPKIKLKVNGQQAWELNQNGLPADHINLLPRTDRIFYRKVRIKEINTGNVISEPVPVTGGNDRKVAEWIIQLGGNFNVTSAGQEFTFVKKLN